MDCYQFFVNFFVESFAGVMCPENEFKYQNEDLLFDNEFVNDYRCYLIFRRDRLFNPLITKYHIRVVFNFVCLYVFGISLKLLLIIPLLQPNPFPSDSNQGNKYDWAGHPFSGEDTSLCWTILLHHAQLPYHCESCDKHNRWAGCLHRM